MVAFSTKSAALSALLAASTVSAAVFPFSCSWGRLVYDSLDPVVSAGKKSGHQHAIQGGNGFKAEMDFADTQASSCTSCKIAEDFSNYWTPSLYYRAKNGSVIPLATNEFNLYYSMESEAGVDFEGGYQAFPKEFRMLAGTSSRRSNDGSTESQFITWSCHNDDQPIDPHRSSDGIPQKKCDMLAAEIQFPSCWDGVNSDSDNHMSHVAWPERGNTGKCPDTHPYRFIAIFMISGFDTKPYVTDDLWWDGDGAGHPWVASNGDTTGFGWHGDFVNGWKDGVLEEVTSRVCANQAACSDILHDNPDMDNCKIDPVYDTFGYVTLDGLPDDNVIGSPGSGVGYTPGQSPAGNGTVPSVSTDKPATPMPTTSAVQMSSSAAAMATAGAEADDEDATPTTSVSSCGSTPGAKRARHARDVRPRRYSRP